MGFLCKKNRHYEGAGRGKPESVSLGGTWIKALTITKDKYKIRYLIERAANGAHC